MSVGLLVVRLLYRLYACVHLSKWFVNILMFKFWSVCRLANGRPTIAYNLLIGDVCSGQCSKKRLYLCRLVGRNVWGGRR
jgi:hypothetical protein